jgi:hypothetical protein
MGQGLACGDSTANVFHPEQVFHSEQPEAFLSKALPNDAVNCPAAVSLILWASGDWKPCRKPQGRAPDHKNPRIRDEDGLSWRTRFLGQVRRQDGSHATSPGNAPALGPGGFLS